MEWWWWWKECMGVNTLPNIGTINQDIASPSWSEQQQQQQHHHHQHNRDTSDKTRRRQQPYCS